jgi:hypothetical protein
MWTGRDLSLLHFHTANISFINVNRWNFIRINFHNVLVQHNKIGYFSHFNAKQKRKSKAIPAAVLNEFFRGLKKGIVHAFLIS